jgi:hypothetical protein
MCRVHFMHHRVRHRVEPRCPSPGGVPLGRACSSVRLLATAGTETDK